MCALGKTLFYIIYITGIVELPNINVPRLATSQLANIFGNDTIYRHGKKKIEKGKKPRNKPNKPSAEGASELRSAETTSPLANIFGNDTIYWHDKKKLTRAKKPRNKLNKSCEGLCESLQLTIHVACQFYLNEFFCN